MQKRFEAIEIKNIRLRPAVFEDVEMVFRWRNDPFIITRSGSQETVNRNEHLEWFRNAIDSDRQIMFIIEKENEPIGQVRFDRYAEGTYIIAAYLLQDFTGKGDGITAIETGCKNMFSNRTAKKIIACVRKENPGARSAFIKAGFKEDSIKDLHKEHLIVMSLTPQNQISSG